MGPINFTTVFKDNIHNRDLSEYAGKIIVIDFHNWFVKKMLELEKYNVVYTGCNDKIITHLFVLFQLVINITASKMRPLFVFDGKPPDIKKETIRLRKEKIYGVDEDNNINYDRKKLITPEIIEECKLMLDLMGIQYIQAINEADAQCAILTQYESVCGVLTADSDVLVFGAKRIFKKIFFKENKVLTIEYDDIINYLNHKAQQLNNNCPQFKRENLIALCNLFGSDYCKKIGDISCDEILNIYIKNNLKLSDTIREIVSITGQLTIEYYEKLRDANKEYTSCYIVNPKTKLFQFTVKRPDIINIIRMMKEKCDLINTRYINYGINILSCAYKTFRKLYNMKNFDFNDIQDKYASIWDKYWQKIGKIDNFCQIQLIYELL